jgi:hypothetical protein
MDVAELPMCDERTAQAKRGCNGRLGKTGSLASRPKIADDLFQLSARATSRFVDRAPAYGHAAIVLGGTYPAITSRLFV